MCSRFIKFYSKNLDHNSLSQNPQKKMKFILYRANTYSMDAKWGGIALQFSTLECLYLGEKVFILWTIYKLSLFAYALDWNQFKKENFYARKSEKQDSSAN